MRGISIRASLRIAGIQVEDPRAREALFFLSQLRWRVDGLRALLPNLRQTLECLTTAAALEIRRPKPARLDNEKVPFGARAGAANFVEWLLVNHPISGEHTNQPSEILLDVLAVRWVHSAALRAFGDQLPTDQLHRDLDSPTEDLRKINEASIAPTAAPSASSALTRGYEDWLADVRLRAPECQIPGMLERLKTIREIGIQTPQPRPVRPPPRLDERQLCKSHWHFPRPSELSKLHKCLERELSGSAPSTRRNEAGLIALSIFACRPVQNVMRWPMCARRNKLLGIDRIGFTLVRGHITGTLYWASAWLKAEHERGSSHATVALPWGVQNWLNSVFPGIGTPKILDILPFSEEPWDLRAYNWLASELGCTRQRAELIVRDLVPRLIYDETSNAALVHFWRSDSLSQVDRSDRVALSHYLHASGKRVKKTFARACKLALGDYGSAEFNSVYVRIGSEPLNSSQIDAILQSLNKAVDLAPGPIERHNALASLALFMCLFTTGHRRSTTPFPFPWDFTLSENLVFICDKLVTGSEARFVPLTLTASWHLKKYVEHLQKIARNAALPEATREYVNTLYAFLHAEDQPPTRAIPSKFAPTHGVFFWLKESGGISEKRLTTGRLDSHIQILTGFENVTRRLRSTIANFIWEEGCSGREVQAFLGHQPELHVHGHSSTWSVLDVAERISPIIESYFVKLQAGGKTTPSICFPSGHVPSITTTASDPDTGDVAPGYEGREREAAWAMHRARTVIRQEISEYLLDAAQEGGRSQSLSESEPLDAATTITKDDVKQLRVRIQDELASDPQALRKVTSALDEQLEKLRRSKGLKVSTGSAAYRLSAPGPVEVGFSRLLRCGLVFRQIWEGNVGIPLGVRNFDRIERLAHLTISLVCFEGVLALENLEGLVLSAARGEYETYDGCITLRCNVTTKTHDCEFSVRPGPATSALILGVTSSESQHQIEWQEVTTRVIQILSKMMNLGAGSRWSVLQLCLLMRPYWLLRLPGAMYAVATGQFKGPAADSWSEAQLHGLRVPPTPMQKDAERGVRMPLKEKKALALKGLLALFRKSVGEREKGERRRLVQRAKLKRNLQSDSAKELTNWSSETQIVALLLTFIERLVTTGGPRVKALALTSMETYFRAIAEPLIQEAWEFDFEGAEPEDLRQLLDGVSKTVKSEHGHAVLKLFCAHLRDEMSLPFFSALWFSPRVPIRVRSSVLLPTQVTRAIALLHSQSTQEYHHAAQLVALGFGYGLRRLEVFGLGAHQFDPIDEGHLCVARTRIADLKTPSGRRVLAKPLSNDKTDAVSNDAVALARTSHRPRQFLFESASRDFDIAPIGPISTAAIRALRAASGLPTAVVHHLRHSFATIFGLALFAPEKGSGRLLEKLASRYVGPSYGHRIRETAQMPKGWPFGVDALANVLGHVDSGTFLNVYFHGSHLVIADRCARWQPTRIQQARLGNMLGRDRTAISRVGTKLKSTYTEAPGYAAVVQYYAERRTDDASIETPADPDVQDPLRPARWAVAFRALEYRMANGLSIEEMEEYAHGPLGFSVELAKRFVKNYAELVRDTGIDDFEPEESTLLKPRRKPREGVSRGAIEREHFVSQVQAWAELSEENSVALDNFMLAWAKRFDSSKPLVVCRNAEELAAFVELLTAVGASKEQLRIGLHGNPDDPWLRDTADEYPTAKHSPHRASRGFAHSNVTEVSITVDQMRTSLVPDGRDLHRSLIGLFAVSNMQRVW